MPAYLVSSAFQQARYWYWWKVRLRGSARALGFGFDIAEWLAWYPTVMAGLRETVTYRNALGFFQILG